MFAKEGYNLNSALKSPVYIVAGEFIYDKRTNHANRPTLLLKHAGHHSPRGAGRAVTLETL